MRIESGQLISLGYGRYVRSDAVTAVEPVVDGRGPGKRSIVWVEGVPQPLIGSRAEDTVARDLVTSPSDELARSREVFAALERLTDALEEVPAVLLRVVERETGVDLGELADQSRRVLSAVGDGA
ncbi:MAG: hypothetical protein ACE5EF_13945 [Dehalococcoidia bacterium]